MVQGQLQQKHETLSQKQTKKHGSRVEQYLHIICLFVYMQI
jgi:hypothetical protein